jgi:hypothetical protein
VLRRITPGLSKDGMVLPDSNTIKASEPTGFHRRPPKFDLDAIVNDDAR